MNTAATCGRRGCGAVLEIITDGNGRVLISCPPCQRNRRDLLCRSCPAPIATRAKMYCDTCRAARRVEQNHVHDRRRYAESEERRAWFATWRARPEVKEKRRLAEAARRAAARVAAAPDNLDRLYWRERQRRLRADPKRRAKRNARTRALYRKRIKADPTWRQRLTEADRQRRQRRQLKAAA